MSSPSSDVGTIKKSFQALGLVGSGLLQTTVHNATADSTSAHFDLADCTEIGRRTEECRTRRFGEEDGPPSVFVRPSMREAVLTVSPWTVYSSRRSEPTFPDMNGPLFDADAHAIRPRRARSSAATR